MPDSDPTTHILDVPGARLYYERRGSGPLLLMIGSPMDSSGFAPLASALADHHTVVTYDPRGIGNSSREVTSEDVTPQQQADDVHRLLSALGGEPADVFGSSGGAVVGLALVTAHPDQVRTLVAHEPPVVELLPDAAQLRAEIEDIYGTHRAEGAEKAMQKFMAHAGLGEGPGREADAPRWEPSPEQMARMRATPTSSWRTCSARPRATVPTSRRCGRRRRASWSPAGPRRKGSSPTVPPWHWPTSSARPWSTSPVTTADSWPSRSSVPAYWTRCSPKRPEPAVRCKGQPSAVNPTCCSISPN